MTVRCLIACVLLLAPLTAFAGEAIPTEQDPVAARRAVTLAEELRCLVCQNQSIAESNAALALDLRRQIAEQVAAGKSDNEIVDYMVNRYGDFVLYRPPLKATTVLLWLGPFALLIAGVMLLIRTLRLRRSRSAEQPLSDNERARAEALLANALDKDPK